MKFIKFLNENEVLLAPNGKPSNLSKKLYEYVMTLEFKVWFGDWENDLENSSKVVDYNGEPMLVFHGTDNEFTEFEKSYHKNRYFFTEDVELSLSYGNKILKVFLNLKTPNNIEFSNTFDYVLINRKYDGVIYNSETEKGEPINVIIVFNSN